MLQLFSMIKSEDGIKRRGDFFWSVVDFSFENDTIGHIFTGQYYGLQLDFISFLWSGGGIICALQTHFILKKSLLTKQLCP